MKKKLIIAAVLVIVIAAAVFISLIPKAPDVAVSAPQTTGTDTSQNTQADTTQSTEADTTRDSAPSSSPEGKIESALESSDSSDLYSLIYSGKDDEPTAQGFAEGIALMKEYFDFGGNVSVEKDGDDYIATDSEGNTLRFSLRENGKYEMTVESANIYYTVYAPRGSRVTLDGIELTYSESTDSYFADNIERGQHTLTVEKEGCVTYEATVDTATETESKINLDYTEAYLTQYETMTKQTLMKIMETCASEITELEGINYRDDYEKMLIEKLVTDTVNGLLPEDENFKTDKIKLGNLRFVGFVGEPSAKYSETAGELVAKFQYEYSYNYEYYGEEGVKSDTGTALVTMQEVDGIWYLTSCDFTMKKSIY